MRSKKFFYRLLVGACALIIVGVACFSPMMASATYVDEYSNDAQKLEQIRTLVEASSRCLGSTERKSTTLSLSSRSSENNQYVKDFYELNSNKMFESKSGKKDSNLIFSATLEIQTSGGYKDSKLYCSELNLIPNLLTQLGQYTNATRDSLICDGSKPGLFSVTTGYGGDMFGAKYDNDGDGKDDWPAGWPEQDDCSGNLALLIDYVENRPDESIIGSGNGNHDYPFNVKLTPSPNAAQHFQRIVGPMLGSLSALANKSLVEAMDYWRYYQAFESGCAKVNNGNTTPPAASSTNMNKVYDAVTKTFYYHSDSEINYNSKIYYNVKDASQLTCKELATKLGENADTIALTTQYGDVQSCIQKYSELLNKLEKQIGLYSAIQSYGTGFRDYLNNIIKQIRNGKFEPTEAPEGDSNPDPTYFNLQTSIQNMVDGHFSNGILGGVDGKAVYSKELYNTIVSAFKDIANNVVMSSNKIDIESRPNDETLDEFDKLLESWQGELDRVESETNSAENLLKEKRELVNKGVDDSRDKVWAFDEDSLSVTCPGLEVLDKEISDIMSVPPDIDTSWSGAVVDSPDYNYAGTGADIDDCTGSAGSLGWILCPVLKMVSKGVDDIYHDYVQKQFLEVDANKLKTNGSDTAVYDSWKLIRNFANIIFIILFLIVVLSQLTGIGLTNYGIKKMLPQLVIVAVLVNISFLLCQIAVDVSNVLGYGANSLFNQLGNTLNDMSISFNGGDSGSGTLASWVSVFGLAIVAGTAGSWLPAFLLVLLSAAISVFFGAIILGARQAGIFILVVLSPVAIVCYALPNLKKVFSRWFKIFTALLMVFPICGALMGGGNFASTILLASGGGFFLTLVAMLLRVVPFFLIPGMVRNSMSAMGNIGAKIAGIGSRLGGNAVSNIRKSDGFQRFSELGEQLRGRGIQARHKILGKITGGRYTGSAGSKRRLARAISAQEARIRGDAKAGAIASGGFISRGRIEDIEASARDAEETQGIKDAENGYRLSDKVDVNNTSSVKNELQEQLDELNKNPENVEVRRKVKALTKILLETDDGRGALMEATQAFASTHQGSEVTKILGKYLGNGENMGKIKSVNQRGLQNLVKDINNGTAIKTLADYGAMGVNKINANAVGGMDVSSLKAQVAAANAGVLSGEDLQRLANKYTQALTSENAANNISDESAEQLNKIRRLAYMENHNYSDDGFQDLNPGDELKVRHTKAAVPTGWTASGVWIGGGSGPTQQQQIAYQEWARHSAEVDRHNSQIQQ